MDDLRPATCDLRPATCDLRPATCDLRPANLVNHALQFCVKGFFCALICIFAFMLSAAAAETAQETEFASAPSATYTSDDARDQKAPPPQPPSFSMAHLPAAPEIKLQTLNSDEIARLRPNAQGLTPIGVHRKLPPDLIQDVLPEDLDTANKDTNSKDNLLPVPQPRSQSKPSKTLTTGSTLDDTANTLTNGVLTQTANRISSGAINSVASGTTTNSAVGDAPTTATDDTAPRRTHSLVQGAWQWVGNGRLWRVQIHSPGAQGLRVHFQDFNVGTGRVWLHTLDTSADRSAAGSPVTGSSATVSATGSSASGLDAADLSATDSSAARSTTGLSITGGGKVYGPYTGRGMYGDGDFWSDIVFNSRLVIEYQPGPEDTNLVDRGPVPFRIQNISHLTNLNLGRPSARRTDRSARHSGSPSRRDDDNTNQATQKNNYANGSPQSWQTYQNTLQPNGLNNRDSQNNFESNDGDLFFDQNNFNKNNSLRFFEGDPSRVNNQNQNAYNFNDDVSSYDAAQNQDIDSINYHYLQQSGQQMPAQNQAADSQGRMAYYNDGLLNQMAAKIGGEFDTDLPRRDAAWCQVDVSCFYSVWGNAAAGVARILFETPNGNTAFCSGVLLTDTDASSAKPYFLTAAHCIKTNAVARTLVSWWFYETARCNTAYPLDTRLSIKRGSRLLYTTGYRRALDPSGDATLLLLTQKPPSGAYYQGWTSHVQSTHDNVVGIHHPGSPSDTDSLRDLKRISFGKLVWPSGPYLGVRWLQGTVEQGSSGSPLFNDDKRVIGVLSGSFVQGWSGRECIVGQTDEYSKFSSFYPQIRRYLRPDREPEVVRPTITSFTSSSYSITEGESITLYWQSTHATKASINGRDLKNSSGAWVTSGNWVQRPTRTTTYRLVVTSRTGHTAEKSIRVTVRSTVVRPTITSFTSSSYSITEGESITLYWRSTNATKASINGRDLKNSSGAWVTSGNWVQRPTRTTTYRLVVTSRTGHTDEESRLVTVKPRPIIPRIISFAPSPASITRGNSVTLRWQVTNANRVQITPAGGTFTSLSGSTTVRPSQTTTYTLRATSSTGHASTQTTQVQVTAPVDPITAGGTLYNARPKRWRLGPGQGHTLYGGGYEYQIQVPSNASRLSFTLQSDDSTKDVDLYVRYGQSVGLSDGQVIADHRSEGVTGNESIEITSSSTPPLRAGTYYIALGLFSTNVVASGSLTANIQTRPSITSTKLTASFGASQWYDSEVTIEPGSTALLRWHTENATSVRLDGFGSVNLSGSKRVKPSRTSRYTLIVTGRNGQSLRKQTTVTVRGTRGIDLRPSEPPMIEAFTTTHASIRRGQSVQLNWRTSGAETVSLKSRTILDRTESCVNCNAQPTGSLSLPGREWSTYYTLIVENPRGHIAKKTILVEVNHTTSLTSMIQSFTATKYSIIRDESVDLNWRTRGATSLQIDRGPRQPASYFKTVSPRTTTEYDLTARDANGNIQKQSITIEVRRE